MESKGNMSEGSFVVYGMLGVSIAVLLTILTLADRDVPLTIAIYCVAFSIPMLVASVFAIKLEEQYETSVGCPFATGWTLLGAALALASLVMIFWHFSWWCGVAFLVASALSAAAYVYMWLFTPTFRRDDEEANPDGEQT